MPFKLEYPDSEKIIPKPHNIDEIIYVAEKLSEGLYFARIDLYNIKVSNYLFAATTDKIMIWLELKENINYHYAWDSELGDGQVNSDANEF